MEKVIDLVKDDDVRQLTDKETILAGHELWKQNEVVFGTFKAEKINAKVTEPNGEQYNTSLEAINGKLSWSCSCSKGSEFCKHLVATVLDAQREGRGDIFKAAGILIQNHKMLVERSIGKPAYIAPGGRIQNDETSPTALARELKEEFQIHINQKDLEPFGRFSAQAANHPGQQVHMDVFFVKKWQGAIKPSSEVEEIAWITSKIPKEMKVGSIFEHEVIPRLKAKDLID